MWPSAPSLVTSLGCSPSTLPMTVPCQVPQPAQGQPCPLQGLLQAPAGEGEQENLQCSVQAGFAQSRADAEQQCSCSAFPEFLPLGQQHGIVKEQALCICAVVHIPIHHSLGLQGAGVTSGSTRNNPNPAELQLRADESCRSQSDSVQGQMDETCIHINSFS